MCQGVVTPIGAILKAATGDTICVCLNLAFYPVTVLSLLENLCDSVTDEKKPPWPGDFVVSLVAALSIAPMGGNIMCFRMPVPIFNSCVTS